MKNKLLFISLLLAISFRTFSQQVNLVNPSAIDISYKKYVLDNGLRLIVHEDHKAPIAAVNVWYHVGSKNEKPGKSGFAHLFEHLMFNGSEHFNMDYFKALENIGATDLNGTTNNDRTNYFQNVPLAALDQVLWLESDRMGHLLGVIDSGRLNEQRGVVQNEKRQGENQPYGLEWELSTKASYNMGHPYSWTVIGSMEDLNAASLEDVKNWFRAYYGAANAVLVIAGDVKADEVYEKVKKYFGNIPAGPTLAKFEKSIAKRTENTRQAYQDRVNEARISMYWNVPQWGSREAVLLDLVSDVLSRGKNSRLYKKLVFEDQVASIVYSYNDSKEIGGTFNMTMNVKPGGDHSKVEQTANELLQDLILKGPTTEELKRVKSDRYSQFIKGMERIGGFGGKSDILAESEVYGNNPEYYKNNLKWIAEATVEDVHKAAKDWLSTGKHTLICTPFPTYKTASTDADRSKLPALTTQPESSFPDIQTTKLKNGLKVVLARRKDVPTVAVDLLFSAGYAADQFTKPGTANLAMNLLDEGTKTANALQISAKAQLLGSSIYTYSDLDASYVRMDALKSTFNASLDLFADIVLNPSFAQSQFARLQREQLDNIQREKTEPFSMALRVFPKFFYGEGHAYSLPFSGSGYEKTVSALTRTEVVKFYDTWIKPNNATLLVVGDIEMASLLGKLESRFGKWQPGEVPKKNLSTISGGKGNRLYLIDRPESQQSVVIAGYLTEPYGKLPEIPREALMNVFGGDFTSRINMNLREDKHWSYGAGTYVPDAKGQRPMLVYTSVQTDKTKESLQEIKKEYKAVINDRPITNEEFQRTKSNVSMQLPGKWETNGSILQSLVELVKYELPENYFKQYSSNVKSMSLEDVQKLSKKMINPDNLSWIVVGDSDKILKGLKEIGFDEIVKIDTDGNAIQASGTRE
ncbi:MAG TPA: pitrilysin family protein [Segetibacter sp.]|nr:pitrilysin family protein [Segetibacter sp.]